MTPSPTPRQSPWPTLLALFAINFLATSEFWSLFISTTDEAVCLLGAQRWLAGEWPYRDWSSHISPGSYLITMAWAGIAGFSVPSPRILAGLIWALTSVLVQLGADRSLAGAGRLRFLPWLLWTTGGVLEFPILNYHWMAAAAVSLALFWGLCWVQERRRGAALAMGLSAALAGWLLQSEGLAALLMAVMLSLRFRLPHLSWFAGGVLAGSLVLWLPVLPCWEEAIRSVVGGGSHRNFSQFLYSWQALRLFLSHYQGLSPADGWIPFGAVCSHIALNFFRYGFFPILLGISLLLAERRRDREFQVLAWALLMWTLALSNRLTVQYLSFLTPGWALLVAKLIQALPRPRVWGWALAGLAVAGWGFRWAFRWSAYQYPIVTRQGVLYSLNPLEAQAYAQIGSWLAPLTPGTEVLCFPNLPNLYVLYGLRNPIPEAILVPLSYPPEVFDRARALLDQKKVEWIVYLGPDSREIATEFHIDPAELERSWEEARVRMTQGYRLQAGNPRFGLYRRL